MFQPLQIGFNWLNVFVLIERYFCLVLGVVLCIILKIFVFIISEL